MVPGVTPVGPDEGTVITRRQAVTCQCGRRYEIITRLLPEKGKTFSETEATSGAD